jgi:uncharacterized protein with PIN domain
MLGSLARKLRVFGFDTAYYGERHGDDAHLLAIAKGEGRSIITADEGLAARAQKTGVPVYLVHASSDSGRLHSIAILAAGRGLGLTPGESRCALCNGELDAVSRESVRDLLPGNVVSRHRLFYSCRRCRRIYWRGGHWKKLRRLRARLGAKKK